jgi:hypothetical protein
MSRGRPRLSGPRDGRGRLIYHWETQLIPCACGGNKTPGAQYCRSCPARPINPRRLCICGREKSYHRQLCLACRKAARRPPLRYCEWCSAPFRRTKHGRDKDVFRFCSRECHFARLKAIAAVNQETRRAQDQAVAHERAIDRALTAAARRAITLLRACKHCGASMPEDRRQSVYCGEACRIAGTAAHVRGTRARNKPQGLAHVCPNCGIRFTSHEGDVFCSARCSRQLKHRRYGSFRWLDVDERNRIAELVALARAANRFIDQSFKP